MRFPVRSLSTKITLGVVTAALLIGVGSFWILQGFYRRQMIDSLAESTTVQGKLIEESLRHAMHTRSLDLLAEMVRSLAMQKGVEKVMILDKEGTIQYSSRSEECGQVLSRSDRTCLICHQHEPSTRGKTVIFQSGDQEKVFRNVNPILNSESCQECHDPRDRVNGVLIVDYSMSPIETNLSASAHKLWLSAIILAAVITLVTVIIVRLVVLKRLGKLAQTMDGIEAGMSNTPVAERGGDEIATLSQHLSHMIHRLEGSHRSIREREAFLDAVLNAADDGIVVVDEQLRIVTSNDAYARICGTDRANLPTRLCGDSLVCHGHGAGDCPARLTFEHGSVARRIRTVRGGNGRPRHYEIASSPLQIAGRPLQVLEIWRDITTRRDLEAQLAHSERLASLGVLASGLSHEINNPLASILTCLDGLRRRLRSGSEKVPPEFPEYLELIRGEVQRCRELTAKLKVLSGRSRGVPVPVDLRAVIDDTLRLVDYEAQRRSVRIEKEIDQELPPVLAEESQMHQVLLNILLNAIQAIAGSGMVSVRASATGGEVCITVADTGCGIEPEDLGKIFEPFHSQRSDGQGTGLGLFISRIIVDQIGGRLEVASEPGRGTCFTIHFPAATDPLGTLP